MTYSCRTRDRELFNTKVLILKTPVPIPFIDKIKITISKPSLLNTNPKLAIIAQPMSIINSIPIIKFKKLPDPLIFNKN